MRFYRFIFIAGIALELAACSPSDLPEYRIIQGLRVLNLEVDAPEINFDGTTFTPNSISLTPVTSDLYGGGRSLIYSVEWCLDPGIGIGITPTCDGNSTRTVVATDQAVSDTATFLSPNYTGSLTPITVDFSLASAPALAILGQRFATAGPAIQFNGFAILIFFRLTPVGIPTETITAFKRVLVSGAAKVTKNSNPTTLEVRLGGSEITSLPTVDTELLAFQAPSDSESYSFANSNGTFTTVQENLDTTWFLTGPADPVCANDEACTSDGLFRLTRTRGAEVNLFRAPITALPTSRGRVLIAVTRDGRGGSIGKRYCFGTCP